MIIGIPSDDALTVSDHFGRSKTFVLIELWNGMKRREIVDNPHNSEPDEKSGHGRLLKMLAENRVNMVVCVNLNPRMQKNLESMHIAVTRCEPGSRIDAIIDPLHG
ncbi:MAG: hypothetical protein M1321_00305 [Candidatus Marsarchaeota archaeon]|nr:hypothetical protein [Candidatus Marsarchaeota archaeon]